MSRQAIRARDSAAAGEGGGGGQVFPQVWWGWELTVHNNTLQETILHCAFSFALYELSLHASPSGCGLLEIPGSALS